MKKRVLKLLQRDDKWFLSDGKSLLWAPQFPKYLDKLGYWEKAYYFNYDIEPLYTVDFFENGNKVSIKQESRVWTPDKLKCDFIGEDYQIEEYKTVFEGCLNSEIYITNNTNQKKEIDMVVWGCRLTNEEGLERVNDVSIDDGYLKYVYNKKPEGEMPGVNLAIGLGCSEALKSYSINLSEGRLVRPIWRMSPFYEKFNRSGFINEIKVSGIDEDGVLYMALHYNFVLEKGERKRIQVSAALDMELSKVRNKLKYVLSLDDIHKESEKQWESYFESLPYFTCSDPYMEKYYWYRWYSIRLNSINQREENYKYPFIAEGVGFFRNLISYSSPCNMIEAKWLNTPELAKGILYNFIQHQDENGCFPGIIGVTHNVKGAMYHAHWAKAIRETFLKYRDKDFLEEIYPAIKKYVVYFMKERDKENSGLYDIVNQVETGQEYSPRYVNIEKNADKMDWDKVFQLKGVDSSIYIYELKRLLEFISDELNYGDDKKIWSTEAIKTKRAIIDLMWDHEDFMFYDVDPRNWRKSKVKSVVCFYPFMTDIVDEGFLGAIDKHLLNPREFWTEYPVPTVSVDNEFFNAEAEWKTKRHLCPWNGRVWPMTESHIVDALYNASLYRVNIREKVVELLNKFIKMMFYDNDANRPNCYEHYNPFTGKECFYRGIDDYQHSWVIDLILKYICGIHIEYDSIVIEPLDFNISSFKLDNMIIDGKSFTIKWNKDRQQGKLKIYINGNLIHESENLGGYVIKR